MAKGDKYGQRGGKVGKGSGTQVPPRPNIAPATPAGGTPPPRPSSPSKK
jgi:hypothetical protein